MKIELIGFGAKLGKRLEENLRHVFPRIVIIRLDGPLTTPRVVISVSRRKRLRSATDILLHIEL